MPVSLCLLLKPLYPPAAPCVLGYIVRYVHARVTVRDLFGRLAQELSLPGVTADLVDDVDRRIWGPTAVSEYDTGGLD